MYVGAGKSLVTARKNRWMWASDACEKLTMQAQLSEVFRKDEMVQDCLTALVGDIDLPEREHI